MFRCPTCGVEVECWEEFYAHMVVSIQLDAMKAMAELNARFPAPPVVVFWWDDDEA